MDPTIEELRGKIADLQESIDRGTEVFLEIGTSSSFLVNELVSGGFNLPSIFAATVQSFTNSGRAATLEFIANPPTNLTAVQLDFSIRAAQASLGISAPVVPSPTVSVSEPPVVAEALSGFLDLITPHSFPLEGLLETLSNLLLNPSRVPGEPCLAPTPLLNDLLDLALGKIQGGIDAIFGKVGSTVLDLLIPAAATGDDLAGAIQAVLDDPITAALNLVLGAQNQVDCVVTAHKDVGESVIEVGFKRLVRFVEEALG